MLVFKYLRVFQKFVLLICKVHVVRMNALCYLNIFTFIQIGFPVHYIFYLGKCSMYTWKECIFCFCGCNILKCQYDQVVDSDDKIYMLADLQQSLRSIEISTILINFIISSYSLSVVVPCILKLC